MWSFTWPYSWNKFDTYVVHLLQRLSKKIVHSVISYTLNQRPLSSILTKYVSVYQYCSILILALIILIFKNWYWYFLFQKFTEILILQYSFYHQYQNFSKNVAWLLFICLLPSYHNKHCAWSYLFRAYKIFCNQFSIRILMINPKASW